MKKETFINEKIPHESAIKHVSGKAHYTDDIPEPPGTLYGAIGWSKKSKAIIKILSKLPFPWKFFSFFIAIFPNFFRDIIYNFIAKIRYKIFEKKTTCELSEESFMDRLI